MSHRKNALPVKLNPLSSNGNRKVKGPTWLQKFANVRDCLFVAICVYRVAVSAQAKMFNGMQ